MLTTSIGRLAEDAVCEYLQNKNFDIIAQNWRTRYCEIDIVAYKKRVIYFVEVKYRNNVNHGNGFEYITDQKVNRMHRAAELWVAKNNWYGSYTVSAASVTGVDYKIGFITDL